MEAKDQGATNIDSSKNNRVFENCPHCDNNLTLWEQVLLKVDGALICKKCWYRIHLNGFATKDKSDSVR